MFSYVYLHQIVLSNVPNVNDIVHAITRLGAQEQLLVFREVEKILFNKQILKNLTSIVQ